MAFSFSFSGDDIDADESEVHNDIHVAASVRSANNALPELEKARKHDMSEWVSSKDCPGCRLGVFGFAFPE